jgi:transposase-like protein
MRKRGETELPPANTRRWTIRRKAAVLEAMRSGTLTLDEACKRYALSVEELRAWERQFQRHGLYGLRTTRVQIYRKDS